MKKRIIVFMCAMMVLLMATGVVFATTESGWDIVDKSTYNKQYVGSSSVFWARAYSDNVVYTTIENTSSSTRYLSCQIREYKANFGWQGNVEEFETVYPGIQLNAVYEYRDTDLVGYYYHHGKCYMNQYSGAILDTYTYKAYQDLKKD